MKICINLGLDVELREKLKKPNICFIEYRKKILKIRTTTDQMETGFSESNIPKITEITHGITEIMWQIITVSQIIHSTQAY